MYKTVNKNLSPKRKTDRTSWDYAIKTAKAKIKELENAVEAFERYRRNGDPFPGEKVLLGQREDL